MFFNAADKDFRRQYAINGSLRRMGPMDDLMDAAINSRSRFLSDQFCQCPWDPVAAACLFRDNREQQIIQ